MRVLFAFVVLSCATLAMAAWCPGGVFCNGVCCKSWFHYRCCPSYDGVCCEGGFLCCAGGRECVKLNSTYFCVGHSADSVKPVLLEPEPSLLTQRLGNEAHNGEARDVSLNE